MVPFTEEHLKRLQTGLARYQGKNVDETGPQLAKLMRKEGTESLLERNQFGIHKLRADTALSLALGLHHNHWGRKEPTSSNLLSHKARIAAGVASYRDNGTEGTTASSGVGWRQCFACGERHCLPRRAIRAAKNPSFTTKARPTATTPDPSRPATSSA